MPSATIEHVNLTVRDPEHSADLLCTLFGWAERWRGPAMAGGFTVHVGSDTSYIALYRPHPDYAPQSEWDKGQPLNHVGVVVDDLDAVEAHAVALGLTPFSHGDYAPGRRFYLLDDDGIEYEVVSYAA